MLSLKFIIEKGYEALHIYGMLRARARQGQLKIEADDMGVDMDFAKEVVAAKDFHRVEKKISKIVDEHYEKLLPYLKQSKKWYQKSWDEINDAFFSRLQKVTNFKSPHKKFFCVVSAFHIGVTDFGGNKIARIWNENPFTQRRITAHEICIAHFFAYMKVKYPDVKDEMSIWKLAEIFGINFTGLDKVAKRFWPWDKSGSYMDHNYPELVKLQKKLTKIYMSKAFEEFVEKGLEFVDRHSA